VVVTGKHALKRFLAARWLSVVATVDAEDSVAEWVVADVAADADA
jgi:hypothetical protein